MGGLEGVPKETAKNMDVFDDRADKCRLLPIAVTGLGMARKDGLDWSGGNVAAPFVADG